MVWPEIIQVNICKKSHIWKSWSSLIVPVSLILKKHTWKLSYCLLVFFQANALLFQNTKPFSLLLFEFESCCWGVVLLYQVGWSMVRLERSVAVVWFGFTWGQDALTGKQTCVIPAEIWSRSVSCWGCSVNPVYHRVPLMEKCLFIHGNTQRPPWILRPVKMLVSVTLRNDKLGVLVHRLGLCFTQVKLWAAFLHSSGRN